MHRLFNRKLLYRIQIAREKGSSRYASPAGSRIYMPIKRTCTEDKPTPLRRRRGGPTSV